MLGVASLPWSTESRQAEPNITLSALLNENSREDMMATFDLRTLSECNSTRNKGNSSV